MKVKIVAIVCGLVLTASMTLSIVGSISTVASASTGKYERINSSVSADAPHYKSAFLFVCPFH